MRWVALFLVGSACGGPSDPSVLRQRILGGTPGGPTWAVALLRGGTNEVHCSAARLSPRTLLTAAHCADANEALVARTAGSTHVISATLHPHPRARDAAFDVAVVELAEPSESPGALHLAEGQTAEPRQPVLIAGFGTSSTGVGDLRMLEATVETVTATTLTIVSDAGAPCRGDSGAVAARLEPDGTATALAVVSFGDPQCVQATTFARVDTVAHWVRQTMATWEGPSCSADSRCVMACTTPDPDCGCEADGVCGDRCIDARLDPDCASDCSSDGVCSAGPCPGPDADCVAPGVTCHSLVQCASRRCAVVEAAGSPVCTSACETDADCAPTFECGARQLCRQRPERVPDVPAGCGSVPGTGLLAGLWVSRRRQPHPPSGESAMTTSSSRKVAGSVPARASR
ncbi:MAG: trypsin-like serine protease [Myxococcaceae bacterium]|nr:trypsin-like serine protease [Myxococcaceae bacterium]